MPAKPTDGDGRHETESPDRFRGGLYNLAVIGDTLRRDTHRAAASGSRFFILYPLLSTFVGIGRVIISLHIIKLFLLIMKISYEKISKNIAG